MKLCMANRCEITCTSLKLIGYVTCNLHNDAIAETLATATLQHNTSYVTFLTKHIGIGKGGVG